MEINRFFDRLTAAGLALVLMLSPLPLASNRPVFWMIWASFLFFLAGLQLAFGSRSKPRFTHPETVNIMLAFFTLYLGFLIFQIALPTSIAPRASLLALLRVLSYACFFWLILKAIDTKQKRQTFLFIAFLTVVFQCVIGILLLTNAIGLPPVFGKIYYPNSLTGSFINRNSFATYIGFGILTGLYLWQNTSTRGRQYLTLGIALLGTSLFLTNSRFGVIAFLVGLMVFQARTPTKTTLPTLMVLASFCIAIVFFWQFSDFRIPDLGQDIKTRLTLFSQVIEMIKTRPLTGFGADSFAVAFPQFHMPPLDPDLVWDKAHNTYLTNWAELGLIFGSIPVIMAALSVFHLLKPTQKNGFAALAISVIALAATHSLADFSLEIQANMFLFLAIIAIALGETLASNSTHGKTTATHRKVRNG
ncbi:MAG: O-antigen ligase family protein [Rhodobacteraceae bacterium]|nr:O-antigen ligase family protein [Paracoccaceae bacterium]